MKLTWIAGVRDSKLPISETCSFGLMNPPRCTAPAVDWWRDDLMGIWHYRCSEHPLHVSLDSDQSPKYIRHALPFRKELFVELLEHGITKAYFSGFSAKDVILLLEAYGCSSIERPLALGCALGKFESDHPSDFRGAR